MASFFSSFFKGESSVLGVDIGSSSIKVIQLKKKHGRAVLETYGELALGPYANIEVGRAVGLPNSQLIMALKDVLRESKTTTKSCGATLPMSASLITFLTIPPVPEKQIGDVVAIEARKYIPVPTIPLFQKKKPT